MIARNWLARTVYYNNVYYNVYYPDDFEAHKNIFHKQFLIEVYFFMDTYHMAHRALLVYFKSC